MDPRQHASWRRFADGQWRDETGSLASEIRVRVLLNGVHVDDLVASPHDLESLVVGHLLLEGYVFDAAAAKISANQSAEGATVSVEANGARREAWKHLPRVDETATPATPEWILQSVAEMQKRATLYAEGGGVHTSASFSNANLRFLAEDVGKLHSMARLCGLSALRGMSRRPFSIVTTGRITGKMATRAVVMRCPVLVSFSGPSSEGLRVAKEAGMTLVGYARGKGFNVYAGRMDDK